MAKKLKKKVLKKKLKGTNIPPLANAVPKPAVSFWKEHSIPAILLFLLGILLYANTINFGFVLDDSIVIEKNDYVKKGFSGIKEIMNTESFTGYFKEQKNLVDGGRYRPLSLVSFAIENQLFCDKDANGVYIPSPKVSHLISIFLYGLTGLLLYRLLLAWMPNKPEQEWYWSIPFVATLLFVVHPIHTEVVANVKSRDEILMVLFALGSLYACWKYFAKGLVAWLALSAGLFMWALLSKENALTMVAVVPLMGYVFRKTSKDKLIMAVLVFIVVAFGYMLWRKNVIGYFLDSGAVNTDIMNNPFYDMPFADSMATVFYTLGQYLKLLVFPHPLTHDYYPYHIPKMSWSQLSVYVAFLANLILGMLGLYGLLRKKIWAFAILFYFITLSIVSNVVINIGTFMNERFVYLSSIGACLLFAWIAIDYLPKKIKGKGKLIGMGLMGIMVLGFIIKTFERTPAWESPLTLNTAAIQISTESARANLFYGTAIFEEYRVETDRDRKYELLDIANKHVNKAIAINPNYGSAWTMVAGTLAEQHKRDGNTAALLQGFYNVMDHKPTVNFVYTYLDYLKDREAKEQFINFALRCGKMFIGKQDFVNATRSYNYGLSIEPTNPYLYRATGEMYQALGDSQKATEFFNKAAQYEQ